MTIISFLLVLTSLVFWTAIYKYVRAKVTRSPEWCNRVVTLSHGLCITFLSTLSCIYGPWPFTDPGGPNTDLQTFILILSLGYFLFDIGWCLYYKSEGVTMFMHHFCSTLAIARILMKEVSGTEAVAGLAGLEATNPLLQLRWFLRSAGYGKTKIFKVVELTFFSLFFSIRLIAGTYLLYSMLVHPRPVLECKIYAFTMYVISWLFMLFMIKYLYKVYYLRRSLHETSIHRNVVTVDNSSNQKEN